MFTYMIETLQTVLATRDAFRNFGTGWGNMLELDAVGWLWFSVPILGSISERSCSSHLLACMMLTMACSQFPGTGILRLAYFNPQ